MMGIFSNKTRITTALLLCAVLVLVLLTNYGERNTSEKIHTAISSIYEDRLVVEGYIFTYSRTLQEVENIVEDSALTPAEKQERINAHLTEIGRINSLYAATQLTEDEATGFNRFTALSEQVAAHNKAGNLAQAGTVAHEAGNLLQNLSAIQMEEAKAQMDNVLRISSFSSLISAFELVVLVAIAILVQVLVFSSKTLVSAGLTQKAHLN